MPILINLDTRMRRRSLPAWLFGLLVTGYWMVLLNHALWHDLAQSFAASGGPWSQWRLAATMCGRLLGIEILIVAVVWWPKAGKALLILLSLIAAASAYYMDTYGTRLNMQIVQSIFESSSIEARGLLTTNALGWFLLAGVLPSVAIAMIPVRFSTWRRSLLGRLVLVAVLLALGSARISAVLTQGQLHVYQRNHHDIYDLLNPYAALNGTFLYLRNNVFDHEPPLQPYGDDAHIVSPGAGDAVRKRVVILVVGETARADNQSLQGYPRDTNPEMRRRGVYYFRDTWSCGTATTVSVPCMFSGMEREHFDKPVAMARWNLLDILQHAGVSVAWRDNDEGCKGVCVRVPNQDLTAAKIGDLCGANGCLDDVLVNDLPQRLAKMPSPALLVLHIKGSHGPDYFHRYPSDWRRFTPGCDTAELQTCSHEQVVNSYDNTILYTDHILGRIIDALAKEPGGVDTAMLYLSDHGESLGENHIYLHGIDWEQAPPQQKHVPMLLWLSPAWQAHAPGLDACLRSLQDHPWSQDNLFHTVLGLFDVTTRVYQPKLDMLSTCR